MCCCYRASHEGHVLRVAHAYWPNTCGDYLHGTGSYNREASVRHALLLVVDGHAYITANPFSLSALLCTAV